MSTLQSAITNVSEVHFALPQNQDGTRERVNWPSSEYQFVFEPHQSFGSKPPVVLSKEEYLHMIEKGIVRLQRGEADKVVLSRIKRLVIDENLDCSALFESLCNAYPNCLVSWIACKDGSHWIGATPEVLLKKRSGAFEIMSLAGSQKNSGRAISQYEWGTKEQREQLTVTDFIQNQLENVGARAISKSAPYTYIAGPVVHLRTDLRFEFSGELNELVSVLHPTPAVGGYPKNAALKMIDELEPHDRSYYTGVIGFLRGNGDADLFVNLRCMRISGNTADLFVGGGIMPDSNAEKEWEETELKSQTLLRFLDEHQA